MKKANQLVSFIVALALLSALAACGGAPETADTPSGAEPATLNEAQEYIFINTLPPFDTDARFPKQTELALEKQTLNADTVGWLSIPGTAVNEEVLHTNDGNNKFYENKNFEKEYSAPGVLYSDFRGKFGDGSKASLLSNTVIYGHNRGEAEKDIKFGPLIRFADEDFAKETPYVCFSTVKEDLVWEVFAAFYVTVDLPYNNPALTSEQFVEILDEARSRSLYNYNTKVGADDKILTMSTCCYSIPGNTNIGYPSKYRFVVMSKLVDKSEANKTEADFEVNDSPKAP